MDGSLRAHGWRCVCTLLTTDAEYSRPHRRRLRDAGRPNGWRPTYAINKVRIGHAPTHERMVDSGAIQVRSGAGDTQLGIHPPRGASSLTAAAPAVSDRHASWGNGDQRIH